MIISFACKETRKIFEGEMSRKFPKEVLARAIVKLRFIHRAKSLGDLKNPPSNNLEKLKGNRVGQYSVRINDTYRICLRWVGADALDVEIVDYH